jgi:hypothetical protein
MALFASAGGSLAKLRSFSDIFNVRLKTMTYWITLNQTLTNEENWVDISPI